MTRLFLLLWLASPAHALNKCDKIRRSYWDETNGVAKQSWQFQWIASGCFGSITAVKPEAKKP